MFKAYSIAPGNGNWRAVQFEQARPSGAKQAAEKWGSESESTERLPSGPEGRIDFAQLAARVNSCPFKAPTFSAACKAQDINGRSFGTTEVVPFHDGFNPFKAVSN